MFAFSNLAKPLRRSRWTCPRGYGQRRRHAQRQLLSDLAARQRGSPLYARYVVYLQQLLDSLLCELPFAPLQRLVGQVTGSLTSGPNVCGSRHAPLVDFLLFGASTHVARRQEKRLPITHIQVQGGEEAADTAVPSTVIRRPSASTAALRWPHEGKQGET
jgi:hypothetical protein